MLAEPITVNYFTIHVNQTILGALNLYCDASQLFLNKTEGKQKVNSSRMGVF